MEKSKGFIFLSSDDRKSDESAGQVSFNIDVPNITRIGLSSYDVLYGIQNINNNNNLAFIETAAQTFPLLLPTGYYTWSDIVSAVSVALNALGIGLFTVSMNNNIISIVGPVAFRFIINPTRRGRDWADVLGFIKEQELLGTNNSICANISYTDKLYIVADEIHQDKRMRDYSSNNRLVNILGTVYINANKHLSDEVLDDVNDIIKPHHATADINNIKWIERKGTDGLSPITIRILDDAGEPIPLDSAGVGSVRWALVLQYETT